MAGNDGQLMLSELCEAVVDCEHKTAPTTAVGIPSIRTTDIKWGRLDLVNANRVSADTYEEWTRRREPQPGDIILAREAPVGEVGIVPAKTKVCLGQRTVLISLDRDKVNPRYLLYLLMTDDVRADMAGRSAGSTVPHLNMSDIRELALPELPSRTLQNAIASVLGQLEDKIELNRRMNETLGATARAIFRSWFVDFDPVVAKAEGRQPTHMSPDTVALFPNRFEDSAVGSIPGGWSVSTIGAEANLISGRSYKSSELQDSRTALVTLKSFARGGGYRPDGLKSYTGTFRSTQVVQPGHLVVARTDVTQKAEVIGRAALVRGDDRFDRLVASLDVLVVRPHTLPVCFLYCLMRSNDYENHIVGHANGTTVLHLSKEGVPTYSFCKPPANVVDSFAGIISRILKQIDANADESATLATIRDALLPKLLSGEIRLRKAVRAVEEVG